MIKKMFTTIIVLGMVLLAHQGTAIAGNPSGYVTSIEGGAHVVRSGESEKKSLDLNDPVYLGDTVQTAEKSYLQILMDDDSVLNLGEKAQITIKEHIYEPTKDLRRSLYKLIRGKLRVVVGKLFSRSTSRLEVETPTSVIGIRMTEFIVWVVSPDLTIVITIDGEVVAKNIRPDLVCSERVAGGYELEIAKNRCPTVPKETPAERIEEILLETDLYMPPPHQEMPSNTGMLNDSVKNIMSVAPAALLARTIDTLGTGMMGVARPRQSKIITDPLVATAANGQLFYIEPGEVNTPSLPPLLPPPVIPPILLLPLPPPPPGL